MNIIGLPWAGLESKSDAGLWGFSPGSQLSSNVLSALSLEVVFWNWEHISKSFLDKVDIFFMVLDTRGNDQTLSWGDVVHDELLKHSSVDVVGVLLKSESWHTEGVVSEGCSKEVLLGRGEWIVSREMLEEIVGFLVL